MPSPAGAPPSRHAEAQAADSRPARLNPGISSGSAPSKLARSQSDTGGDESDQRLQSVSLCSSRNSERALDASANMRAPRRTGDAPDRPDSPRVGFPVGDDFADSLDRRSASLTEAVEVEAAKNACRSTENSSKSTTGSDAKNANDVLVHVYHCDPYTGFLNTAVLERAEIGIYHAGIEVYGEEWSFQYFEDTWDDPSVSGLIRCAPRRMTQFEYQETLNLGPTTRSRSEVDTLLRDLHGKWPACSYHLTHNNCLTFAEQLVELLQPPEPFPAKLKGILEASRQNAGVDAIVDYSWSWLKWWMIWKTEQQQQARLAAAEGTAPDEDESWWPNWFQSTCSSSVCFAGQPGQPTPTPPKREGPDGGKKAPSPPSSARRQRQVVDQHELNGTALVAAEVKELDRDKAFDTS